MHALLFFLLGTSVFAAPVGQKTARVKATVAVGLSSDHPEVVTSKPVIAAKDYYVGDWFPVEAAGVVSGISSQASGVFHVSQSPPMALQIVSTTEVYSRLVIAVDGSLRSLQGSMRTPFRNYDQIIAPHVLWRRFPTVSCLQHLLQSR